MNSKVFFGKRSGRLPETLLWIFMIIGCAITVMSLIEEICLVKACRDTLSFTFFGISLGWLGLAYFGLILIALSLRNRSVWIRLTLDSLIFSGLGAEFRLLWIQKFVIGSWCPYCVSIACTVFAAVILLVIENVRLTSSYERPVKCFLAWFGLMLPMAVIGLTVAYLYVRQLV